MWDDEIGVSTSLSPKFANISVPYGSLVPAELDGILGAGRHVSCDASSHTFLREIPQCWLTGQAAGIAAALAAGGAKRPRDLDAAARSSASCCARAPISRRPSKPRCGRRQRQNSPPHSLRDWSAAARL